MTAHGWRNRYWLAPRLCFTFILCEWYKNFHFKFNKLAKFCASKCNRPPKFKTYPYQIKVSLEFLSACDCFIKMFRWWLLMCFSTLDIYQAMLRLSIFHAWWFSAKMQFQCLFQFQFKLKEFLSKSAASNTQLQTQIASYLLPQATWNQWSHEWMMKWNHKRHPPKYEPRTLY